MELSEMYRLLVRIPLLQGINGRELAQLEDKTKMKIVHLTKQKEIIARQGDRCNRLMALVEGEIRRERTFSEIPFSYIEFCNYPTVIEPESFFGLSPKIKATYSPNTECDMAVISKGMMMKELMANSIFQLNYLNYLSSLVHQEESLSHVWYNGEIGTKFANFTKSINCYPKGRKILRIRMSELAMLLGETRQNVSNMLHTLDDQGIICLKRNEIFIPQVSRLWENNITKQDRITSE